LNARRTYLGRRGTGQSSRATARRRHVCGCLGCVGEGMDERPMRENDDLAGWWECARNVDDVRWSWPSSYAWFVNSGIMCFWRGFRLFTFGWPKLPTSPVRPMSSGAIRHYHSQPCSPPKHDAVLAALNSPPKVAVTQTPPPTACPESPFANSTCTRRSVHHPHRRTRTSLKFEEQVAQNGPVAPQPPLKPNGRRSIF
jgi:hypothetical protein